MTLAGRRVALYARFSSDRQNEASVDDQLARCRRWVEERGGVVATTFADRAVSAASLDRAGWAGLERAIGAGLVDVIVVESLDRISRRTGDTMQLVERLRFAGVILHALSDGIDTSSKSAKVTTAIRGLVGDLYLDDLADKTRRGMEGRARSGLATGGLPFGYRSSAGANGGRAIEVDRTAADIVRGIFAAYADGRSANEIASDLNARGILPPRSSRRDTVAAPSWQHRTVRAMLTNETYAGRWVWNRRIWMKVPGTNRRVCRDRPQSEWIVQDRPELAVVEQATWNACNARTEAEARALGVLSSGERRGASNRSYLLSGLLRCGVCSSVMAIHGKAYYRCSRASSRGDCTNRRSLRDTVARGAVLEQVTAKLCDRDLIADVRDTLQSVLVEESGAPVVELGARRAELARVNGKIGRLVEALADGGSDAMAAKVRELEGEARGLRAAIAQLELATSATAGDLPSLDELLEGALDVRHAFGDDLDQDEVRSARETLRGALEGGAIRATPVGDLYRLEASWLPVMLVAAARGAAGSELGIAGARFAQVRTVSDVPAARKVA